MASRRNFMILRRQFRFAKLNSRQQKLRIATDFLLSNKLMIYAKKRRLIRLRKMTGSRQLIFLKVKIGPPPAARLPL